MTRALVIGAGVIGAATAHRLAEAGVSVTVLEAGGRTPGTSGATFSIDVTHLKTPHSYFLLNQRSAALHRELEKELHTGTANAGWCHPAPLIQWGDTEEEHRTLRARAERLAAWGHPCRTADPRELRTLAPAIDPASCRATELLVHDNAAWYDAPLLARTLLDRAAALGADIRYDTPVTALLLDGERVRGARARGRCFEADHVVNCAGPDAGRIAELAGVRLPLRQIPGLVGESVPLAEPLRAIVATSGVDLRPAPGNRVCAISWPVDALLAPTPATPVPPEAELLSRCAAILPAFRSLGGTRIGVRPVPEDGLPLVGPHHRAPGLYTITTHSGVTLAPLLAALATQELTTSIPEPALTPYRPDRDTSHPVRDESLALMSGHRTEADEDARAAVRRSRPDSRDGFTR